MYLEDVRAGVIQALDDLLQDLVVDLQPGRQVIRRADTPRFVL